MPEKPAPRLRADAARNSRRIVEAAHAAFRRDGLDVQLDEVAAAAGVSVATLYRRFANKEELVKAVLERQFGEFVAPAIERALAERDPRQAVIIALEAALSVASQEHCTLAAASDAGAMTLDLAGRFFEPLGELIRRGQETGVFRADLTPDDTPRLILMVLGTVTSFRPGEDGWRRYLGVLLDGLSPEGASPLPPVTPIRDRHAPFGSC
ncbi:TetR/AcrR family transcriptional regulator [Amycolatopsis sp. H20-H5]|uniref:TetR/AcrR family transcriptional regulator n=1 Tax=Amycolatopsis sp. H20-H5 TaxID=3046309 RepID=UPI002DBC4760|nr:TetR/AcrR family transcriptional regulator [Amycolatopsis sp. H20-H5]MEC3979677.1 TetR/AcrR family transcriptional regulator [Amycolatopsis sp. H20-H5]